MKENAICINRYGDASVLEYAEINLSLPALNEVRIRHHYSGVNYVDIYHRTGLYKLPMLPAVLGVEGVGIIEALGDSVTSLKLGQRVVYAGLPTGSYATARNLPVDKVILLSDQVSDEAAAAVMLRGITAHMLLTEIYSVKPGDVVLVQAAAGGLGLVLVQWLKALGAQVIGTAGNRGKAELALAHGLDHAILYREEDFVTAVKKLTQGRGVDYAIDGIGGDTLLRTIKTVGSGGVVASVGQVAATVDEQKMAKLCAAHSIKFTRPSVMSFMMNNASYKKGAEATLQHLIHGLQVQIDDILPLAKAAMAHERLASGRTSGSLLLDTSSGRF